MEKRYNYEVIMEEYNKMFQPNEKQFEKVINVNCYYIMRFDGKGMTKRFKPQNQLFDLPFVQSIKDTFFTFCNNHKQQILFGYQCNDEISILIKGTEQDKENSYNRVEKLLSLFASEISVLFDRFYRNRLSEDSNESRMNALNIFDARIFQVSKRMMPDYFRLRQAFGIEHVTTRIQNKTNKKITDKKNIFHIIGKQGQDATELYYGNIFSSHEELCPFEFKIDMVRLKKCIFGNAC